MNRIGIDLGGTKIEGILTDENYKTITRKRIPTNQEEGYNSILESIKNLTLELVQESNDKVSIGVCTPGALSLSSGLIKNSNTQCLIGKDLQYVGISPPNFTCIPIKKGKELRMFLRNESGTRFPF